MEAWLQKQPREVSVAFAARAALRVLPLVRTPKLIGPVGTSARRKERYRSRRRPLYAFRATSVAWAAVKYPAHETELARAAATAAAFTGARAETGFLVADAAANAATRAATTAAAATAAAITITAAATVASAADAAGLSPGFSSGFSSGFATATNAFWSAFSTDAKRVEEGATASVIVRLPLWPDGQPEGLRSLWQEMKETLLTAKQDWQVWTDWYDDRLEGRVGEEARELAYVHVDNDLWRKGPAVANAEIKRRIEELESNPPLAGAATQPLSEILAAARQSADATPQTLRYAPQSADTPPAAPVPPEPSPEPGLTLLDGGVLDGGFSEAIPEQAPAATNFRINSQGLIDVVADPPALEPLTDALQRELYNESRGKAQVLVELGPNLLGELSGPAIRFRESLPERIEDVSISRSWSRGNTLRSRLKAHDLSMSNAEPDPARLPHLVAETLRDLVGTWNVFIVGDPRGRELDEIRPGPQEVAAAKQAIAAAVPVVEAIEHSENVGTPSAVEAVTEQTQAAKNAPAGIDGDQAIELSRKTIGNFVAELLRRALQKEAAFAWKEYRGKFYGTAGTATAIAAYNNWPAIASFVAKNADALKDFVTAVWHNPTLVEIIDLIVRSLP